MFIELLVVLGNLHGTGTGLVARVILIQRRVYHTHVKCHLAGVVRGNEHLRLLFRLRERRTTEYRGITILCKIHQPLDEVFLVWCRRYIVEYLVHFRPVHSHVLGSAVVRYLIVERRQFRHLDEVSETLLLDDVVRHRKLKVRRFLGEDSGPGIEARDVLLLHLLRAQVLEEQVKFRQTVADGRTRQERGAQVSARPFPVALLHRTDGKQQVECLLASLTVAQSCHPVVAGVEHQVLELVAFVYEEVVDAHLAEVDEVIGTAVDSVGDFNEFRLQIGLTLLQTFQHHV